MLEDCIENTSYVFGLVECMVGVTRVTPTISFKRGMVGVTV